MLIGGLEPAVQPSADTLNLQRQPAVAQAQPALQPQDRNALQDLLQATLEGAVIDHPPPAHHKGVDRHMLVFMLMVVPMGRVMVVRLGMVAIAVVRTRSMAVLWPRSMAVVWTGCLVGAIAAQG